MRSLPPPTLDALRRRRLPASAYAKPTAEVARALVGCALVHGERAGVIVETEAYLGPEDLASHARFGPRGRSAALYGEPGRAYVYLCYGVHEMFNVVARRGHIAGAVLIRAIAPLHGLPADDHAIGRGPGKLTQALAIDRRLDGKPLDGDRLFVARLRKVPADDIAVGPRVGVDYAGAWAAEPLRFWWRAHPAVSRTPRPRTL